MVFHHLSSDSCHLILLYSTSNLNITAVDGNLNLLAFSSANVLEIWYKFALICLEGNTATVKCIHMDSFSQLSENGLTKHGQNTQKKHVIKESGNT